MMSDLPHLAGYVEQLGIPETKSDAIEQRNNWVEAAAQFSRNEDYYRGLLDAVAAHIGMSAFTADDGSISGSPIRAAIPDLVAAQVAAIAKLEAERDALREALKVLTAPANGYDGIPPAKYFGDTDFELRYPDSLEIKFKLGDLRKARAALTHTPAGN